MLVFEVQPMACGTNVFVEVEYEAVESFDEAIELFEAG